MAFKTDSIKLKNYADTSARNTAIASPAAGDIALTGGILQVYTSAWTNVDTTPSHSNTVHTASWSGNITLVKDANVESLVFYNITDSTGHSLLIPPVANYGTHAQLQVVNGSDKPMTLAKESGSDQSFWWRASDNSAQVTTVDLGLGQRALFLKTAANYWEVIVLSL